MKAKPTELLLERGIERSIKKKVSADMLQHLMSAFSVPNHRRTASRATVGLGVQQILVEPFTFAYEGSLIFIRKISTHGTCSELTKYDLLCDR